MLLLFKIHWLSLISNCHPYFFVPQIEYFLRKLTEAMGGSWIEEKFENYKMQLNFKQQCLNVWELIELIGMGHFSKGMDRQTLSMGISEVFQELILDVLKQVNLSSTDTHVHHESTMSDKMHPGLSCWYGFVY